ncbi:MAG: hypothetical protein ACMXYD_03665 [Candidatus Woesearchaeota archaeon]
MTEREGDIQDCIRIAEEPMEWEVVLEELKNQIRTEEEQVWITWVGERLDILNERGVNIPILNEIHDLVNNYYDELEKRINNS